MGRKHNTFVSAEERKPQDHKLTRPGAMTLVLVHPRIPQNTGTVARLCAATGSRLHLIRPLFQIDDAKLKRAGLDYWPLLDVCVFESIESWLEAHPEARPWLVEVGTSRLYTEAEYQASDILFFGDEQDGIPPSLLEKWPDRHVRIPQVNVRSINLANSVSIVLYEALRQLKWLDLES